VLTDAEADELRTLAMRIAQAEMCDAMLHARARV
jgi:hypothetical protein